MEKKWKRRLWAVFEVTLHVIFVAAISMVILFCYAYDAVRAILREARERRRPPRRLL